MSTVSSVRPIIRGEGQPTCALELEGVPAGRLAAPASFAASQIVLQSGACMSKQLYDWLAASINGSGDFKTGALIFSDFHWKERFRVKFSGARIAEASFPALAANSQDAARITLKINVITASSSTIDAGGVLPYDIGLQKKWMCCNYLLSITGLNCQKVSSIEPIIIANSALPVFTIMVPATDLDEFRQWSKTREPRPGSLAYLLADWQIFFTLTFGALYIVRIDDLVLNKSRESQITRVPVRLSVGKVSCTFGGSTVAHS